MLLQARWVSKFPSELADPPAVLLFFCVAISFCRSGGNLGQKKVEIMLQYCWAGMGCPYFLRRIQHLYKQICEYQEDGLAQSFLQ